MLKLSLDLSAPCEHLMLDAIILSLGDFKFLDLDYRRYAGYSKVVAFDIKPLYHFT